MWEIVVNIGIIIGIVASTITIYECFIKKRKKQVSDTIITSSPRKRASNSNMDYEIGNIIAILIVLMSEGLLIFLGIKIGAWIPEIGKIFGGIFFCIVGIPVGMFLWEIFGKDN
jgi:hypothetical protein